MFTHSLIDEEITAYTRMSIKQLKCVIHAEQLKDSLVQQVQQRLAISIENRNNLTESEMTNMNIDMSSEMIMTSEMQLRVITIQLRVITMQLRVATLQSEVLKCWKNIDDVVYYNSKIYVLQISALCNAVISQFHDDVFTDYYYNYIIEAPHSICSLVILSLVLH